MGEYFAHTKNVCLVDTENECGGSGSPEKAGTRFFSLRTCRDIVSVVVCGAVCRAVCFGMFSAGARLGLLLAGGVFGMIFRCGHQFFRHSFRTFLELPR